MRMLRWLPRDGQLLPPACSSKYLGRRSNAPTWGVLMMHGGEHGQKGEHADDGAPRRVRRGAWPRRGQTSRVQKGQCCGLQYYASVYWIILITLDEPVPNPRNTGRLDEPCDTNPSHSATQASACQVPGARRQDGMAAVCSLTPSYAPISLHSYFPRPPNNHHSMRAGVATKKCLQVQRWLWPRPRPRPRRSLAQWASLASSAFLRLPAMLCVMGWDADHVLRVSKTNTSPITVVG